MNKEKIVGFDSELEENYLSRFDDVETKRRNLRRELETQLGEDLGLIEFTFKYGFDNDGKIVNLLSGERVVELTARGEVEEETESISRIESGLRNSPEKTWIHFSPRNEKLGYPENCVDFWRVEDGEIIWNRMLVKNNFKNMNKIRACLSGEGEVDDEMEILKSPVGVKLKLAEIFDFFRLKGIKNRVSYETIETVVDDLIGQFNSEFGDSLMHRSDLIFRLYSACFNELTEAGVEGIDLDAYMYGKMSGFRREQSYGCSAETMVGSFGEKIGYYILADGQVLHGEIPEGYKKCKKCGCWYAGESCPFC